MIIGGRRQAQPDHKCAASRNPWDKVLNFKALVLRAL